MKVLFSDLDGTLLCSDGTISEGNLEAIDRMTKAGHAFVIATGRPLASALKIAERYGWNGDGYYISSFNGGLIYECSSGKEIIRHTVPFEYVRYLMDEAKKSGLHCHAYSSDTIVTERETPEVKVYSRAVALPYVVVPDATAYLKDEPVKVIVSSLQGRPVLEPFRERMAEWADGKLMHFFSLETLLEYLNPSSSKGKAVRYMCEHFGIGIEDSVAVGDEENDVTLISEAGTGVCMCNGVRASKEVADYITEHDNNHDGIKEVIEKFVLG